MNILFNYTNKQIITKNNIDTGCNCNKSNVTINTNNNIYSTPSFFQNKSNTSITKNIFPNLILKK